MLLTYTARRAGFEAGKRYANPRFFSTPRRGVTEVEMDGEWPAVRAAYEALGVPVKLLGQASAPPAVEPVVEPPSDWRVLPWSKPHEPGGPTLRGVVKSLGGTAVNAEQARAVIEEAIANG